MNSVVGCYKTDLKGRKKKFFIVGMPRGKEKPGNEIREAFIFKWEG